MKQAETALPQIPARTNWKIAQEMVFFKKWEP